MPLSKPVKKQQLILPSPKDFLHMSKDKMQCILKRLSTDNLIIYMEHVIESYHPSNDNRLSSLTGDQCFTLEQIVEDEVKNTLNLSDADIDEWIAKTASKNPDVEASLMEKSSYAITNAKDLTNSMFIPAHSKNEPRGQIFQDISNWASSANVSAIATNELLKGNKDQANCGGTTNSAAILQQRMKIAWHSVPQPQSGSCRWQPSLATTPLSKENGTQFKPAVERPSINSGLIDLRFTPEQQSTTFNQCSAAPYFANNKTANASNKIICPKAANSSPYISKILSSLNDNKSMYSAHVPGIQAPFGVSSMADQLVESGMTPSTANTATSFSQMNEHSFSGNKHLLENNNTRADYNVPIGSRSSQFMQHTPANDLFSDFKLVSNVHEDDKFSQFDGLFGQADNNYSHFQSSSTQSNPFGRTTGVNELNSSYFGSNSSSITGSNIGGGNSQQHLLRSNAAEALNGGGGGGGSQGSAAGLVVDGLQSVSLLNAFNLPSPSVFNDMSLEDRETLLSALPPEVRHKFEFLCWSHKLSQLYSERPVGGGDLSH